MALLDALFLDPYPVNIWIAVRSDALKGSGTATDPFDGSTQAKFDGIMALFQSTLPADVTIHLGPGVFQTNGWNASASSGLGSGAWQAKAKMKIVGSGIDVTTLKLVNVGSSADHYYAIGHSLGSSSTVDFFEVSEMTIDCNLPSTGSAACGAIQALGNHVRISRIKAINWGTKSTGTSNPCFVFAILAALPDSSVPQIVNSGLEDCLAIAPSPNNAGLITGFHVGAREALSSTAEGFAKSPYIRNCFVDCQDVSGNPPAAFVPNLTSAKYRAISMGWCRGGLVEGNQIWNADIGGPYPHSADRSARDVIVRNNFYRNVGRGPYFKLGALGSSLGSGTLSISVNDATISGTSLTGLAVGDRVKIVSSPATFSGVYVITSIQTTPSNSFHVYAPNPPSPAPTTISSVNKIFGLSRAIIEGNVIELANSVNGKAIAVEDANDSSPYVEPPDYVHGDVFIRNNKIRYVDGAAPIGTSDLAIEVQGIKNLMVSNNVIESANTLPLTNKRAGAVTYFNDKTPAGVLVQGFNADTSKKYEELETDADFGLVLSLFNRQ